MLTTHSVAVSVARQIEYFPTEISGLQRSMFVLLEVCVTQKKEKR